MPVLCFCVLFTPNCGECAKISTYAGDGYNGFGNNGNSNYSGDARPALQAQINPRYIAAGSKGDIYIVLKTAAGIVVNPVSGARVRRVSGLRCNTHASGKANTLHPAPGLLEKWLCRRWACI